MWESCGKLAAEKCRAKRSCGEFGARRNRVRSRCYRSDTTRAVSDNCAGWSSFSSTRIPVDCTAFCAQFRRERISGGQQQQPWRGCLRKRSPSPSALRRSKAAESATLWWPPRARRHSAPSPGRRCFASRLPISARSPQRSARRRSRRRHCGARARHIAGSSPRRGERRLRHRAGADVSAGGDGAEGGGGVAAKSAGNVHVKRR